MNPGTIRPAIPPAQRRLRVQDILLHPITWVCLAVAAGLLVAALGIGVKMRYLRLIVAVAFFLTIVRIPTHMGAGLILIVFPFPTFIWLGDTNFVFTVFLLVVWSARILLRIDSQPQRSPLDWIILAYICIHMLSFLNIEEHEQIFESLKSFRFLATPIGFYYIVMGAGRSERRLFVLAEMFCISMTIVYFTAYMEANHPNITYLPRGYVGGLAAKGLFAGEGGIRQAGLFTHAMLADIAATMTLLHLYLALYLKDRRWLRGYHWIMVAISIYMITLSGNRGGLILLFVGLLYFLWTFSKAVTPIRAVTGFFVLAALFILSEAFLYQFQGEGSLIYRMSQTQFYRGIPDTRRTVWAYIWQRIMERPWLGHGVTSDPATFIEHHRASWPHNAYLYYFFTVGIGGVIVFLLLIWQVLKRTYVGHRLPVGSASFSRGMAAVFHIGALQFFIGQLRTDHQRGNGLAFLMWIIIALGLLAREIWEDEKHRKHRPGRGWGTSSAGPGAPRAPLPTE